MVSGSQVLLKVLFLSEIFNLCISIKSHIVLPENKVLTLKMLTFGHCQKDVEKDEMVTVWSFSVYSKAI